MGSVVDLEAQQVAQVEGAETHKTENLGPHTASVASPLRSLSSRQEINDEAHPMVSQVEFTGSRVGIGAPELNITSDKLTQSEAQISVIGNPYLDPGPRTITSGSEPEEPRMIGDFDGSANEFWKLYRDEAKSHDDARIDTLKEGMESALIFAGLFSATLTAFVIDSKQNLKPSPAEEAIYYLRQHSAILSQISVQLSSISPQVAIPSTPPPPFPLSSPLVTDVRANVFWFMALTFSLLAALLAILVQQWVRNYMHVFQRYGDPLKSSRLRQYLYEGCERWNMPGVAEIVPGFLHVSLFLFFAGLADSLLNINTKVALSTIVPIGVSGLLYIFTTFAPIIYPQSPYQHIFSDILWYLMQKLHGRKFKDHGDGEMKSVSGNMALGQMQLAMEETVTRMDRDVGATRWLIGNLTEDAEMEMLLLAIPGSFNTDWGTEVWKRVGKHRESEGQAGPRKDTTAHQSSSSLKNHKLIRPIVQLVSKSTPRHRPGHVMTPVVHPHPTTAHIQGENIVHELSTRVARSVEVCKNRGLFANDDLWRRRTRACIEATASLIFCADAELTWFGGISKLLGDISSYEKIRALSLEGKDELFVMRWTCLSLLAIRPILADNENMHVPFWAGAAIDQFGMLDEAGNNDTLAAVRKLDEMLKKANDCLIGLFRALLNTKDLTEQVKAIIRGLESEISELEKLNIEADRLQLADVLIFDMQFAFNIYSHQIISQLPGVIYDLDPDGAPIPFSRLVEMTRDPRVLPFICPRQILKSMCSPALVLRNILEGQADEEAYRELMKNAYTFSGWSGDEMERQLLRLQDLRDGGGLGLTVELFFLSLSQLLSTSSPKGSHSALYTGTFRAITSDWSKYKDSLGTQKLLLDIAMSRRKEAGPRYPAYIIDEFLSLLGNIFEGQAGPHIDRARQEFQSFELYGEFGRGVLRAINRGHQQAQFPAVS